MKYGYNSQDAFSRAFRSFHEVLPSTVKNEPVMLKSCPKLSFQITITGAEKIKYQIEQWPVFECYMQENRQEIWIAIEDV